MLRQGAGSGEKWRACRAGVMHGAELKSCRKSRQREQRGGAPRRRVRTRPQKPRRARPACASTMAAARPIGARSDYAGAVHRFILPPCSISPLLVVGSDSPIPGNHVAAPGPLNHGRSGRPSSSSAPARSRPSDTRGFHQLAGVRRFSSSDVNQYCQQHRAHESAAATAAMDRGGTAPRTSLSPRSRRSSVIGTMSFRCQSPSDANHRFQSNRG